jgi:hypothetical protein
MSIRILAAVSATALLASCSQSGSGESAATGETFIQAHTTMELMQNVVQPQADILWSAAGSVSDEDGLHFLRPTTDEGWAAVISSAATVTEMGNLLMTAPYSEGRDEDWFTFARGMVEIGKKNEEALIARADEDELMTLGGDLYNVCKACHESYQQLDIPEEQ